MERLEFWNKNYSRYYRVEEAALVGSMARNETSFGDIDLCVKVNRTQEFKVHDHRDEYIEWRKEVLGYAPPRDFSAEIGMYELDVSRFIKSRDGRIEILRWVQFPVICLTMNPFVKLVENGNCLINSVTEVMSKSTVITDEQAIDIVNNGVPENPSDKKGVFWQSYCNTLAKFPVHIRNMILERDSNIKHYECFANA